MAPEVREGSLLYIGRRSQVNHIYGGIVLPWLANCDDEARVLERRIRDGTRY